MVRKRSCPAVSQICQVGEKNHRRDPSVNHCTNQEYIIDPLQDNETHLKTNPSPIDGEEFDLKVDANGGDERRRELVVSIP